MRLHLIPKSDILEQRLHTSTATHQLILELLVNLRAKQAKESSSTGEPIIDDPLRGATLATNIYSHPAKGMYRRAHRRNHLTS